MNSANAPELYWLVLVSILTGLMWVPYILQLIVQLGPVKAVWDPTGAHPHDADWALRAKRAHYNAIENLAVFAPLVIAVHVLSLGTPATATAAAVYFFARAAHYAIHVMALPVIRTVAFLVGFGCQMVLGARLLGWI
jgi:uncharacterized MAPEG superfamily protein